MRMPMRMRQGGEELPARDLMNRATRVACTSSVDSRASSSPRLIIRSRPAASSTIRRRAETRASMSSGGTSRPALP